MLGCRWSSLVFRASDSTSAQRIRAKDVRAMGEDGTDTTSAVVNFLLRYVLRASRNIVRARIESKSKGTNIILLLDIRVARMLTSSCMSLYSTMLGRKR